MATRGQYIDQPLASAVLPWGKDVKTGISLTELELCIVVLNVIS